MILSEHDEQVLNLCFNPELGFDQLYGLDLPKVEPVSETVKSMEAEAVSLADTDSKQALSLLSNIITANPKYGSAYNNRAQLYRLLNNTKLALNDLESAIQFGDVHVIGKAYSQKAIILNELGKEEEAQCAFECGAKYGNLFCKQQAVKNNPYAAMCNAAVQKMFEKEIKSGK